jgi:hypothetical protein
MLIKEICRSLSPLCNYAFDGSALEEAMGLTSQFVAMLSIHQNHVSAKTSCCPLQINWKKR